MHIKKIVIVLFCAITSFTIAPEYVPPTIVLTELKAFPTAKGYGRFVTGGRGGEIRYVTNLNDSGVGSLRAAWETTGGAYIIFNVAGTITLNTAIQPTANKTVAGQTAFRNGGQGILIKSAGTSTTSLVKNAMSNNIVRFIRFMRGPGVQGETDGDNVETYLANNVIFDHCEFAWGTDEQLSIADTPTVTVQKSMMYWGLSNSTHGSGEHSKGTLIAYSTQDFTFYGNLYAHLNDRNMNVSQLTNLVSRGEFVNNIIYNWGNFGMYLGKGNFSNANGVYNFNVIGNRGKAGPNSSARYAIGMSVNTNNDRHYLEDNITRERPLSSDPEWNAMGSGTVDDAGATAPTSATPTSFQEPSPFAYPMLNDPDILAASDLEAQLLPKVGCYLYSTTTRDAVIADVLNGTGSIIDDPSEVGGYPTIGAMSSTPVDSNSDGIPDDFTSTYTIANNAGYPALELYLAEIAEDFEETQPTTPVKQKKKKKTPIGF